MAHDRLARTILACVPLTDKLRVYSITPKTPDKYRGLHSVELSSGKVLTFEGLHDYGTHAYLVDPSPEVSWPHAAHVVTYSGHMVKVEHPPDPEMYDLAEDRPVRRSCARILRAGTVARFLASSPEGADSLKVDVYRLAEISGLSSTTLRSWIDYGPEKGLTETSRAKLAKALGVEPEDLA